MKRWLAPGPELIAWRQACRVAQHTPRYTSGEIRLLDYTIGYSDLLTLCPQWHDIFVEQNLKFATREPRPRILDCGANVGMASLYFKRLYPAARITAIEADPLLHALLAQNLARNGAADVEAVHAAVWTSSGPVRFRCEGADSGALSEMAGRLEGPDREVAGLRLRDLLQEPVDLLKLDIEGAEHAVLHDCAGALDGVRAMLLDVHEFDETRRVLPDLLALLAGEGFRVSLGALSPLPWRQPAAPPGTPFAGAALCWTLLVRAWREVEPPQ